MDQDKLINLQNQLKHNTDELHEFLRDLDSWEADIKTKDRKLKEDKSHDKSDRDVSTGRFSEQCVLTVSVQHLKFFFTIYIVKYIWRCCTDTVSTHCSEICRWM